MRRYASILLAWLALALPLAQVAALTHELSHRNQPLAGAHHEGNKKVSQGGDCTQCLAYAAFTTGAAVAAPFAVLPELERALAAARAILDGRARLNFPYSSRAPPHLLA